MFFLFLGYYLEKKYKKPKITVNSVLFSGGLVCLLPSLFLMGLWILGYRWNETSGVRFDVFLIVIGLIVLIVGLVYLFVRLHVALSGAAALTSSPMPLPRGAFRAPTALMEIPKNPEWLQSNGKSGSFQRFHASW